MKFVLKYNPRVRYRAQKGPQWSSEPLLNELIGANRSQRHKTANYKTVNLTPLCVNKIHFIPSQLVLGAFEKSRKATISFKSVCPSACNNSATTEWIFIKFGIWGFFENLSKEFKFH
jgi:hypothetical protein